jgi:hypothetical protein
MDAPTGAILSAALSGPPTGQRDWHESFSGNKEAAAKLTSTLIAGGVIGRHLNRNR